MELLVQRLQAASGVSRISVVPHKTYYRVLEVSKAQTKKTEQCEELVRYQLDTVCGVMCVWVCGCVGVWEGCTYSMCLLT